MSKITEILSIKMRMTKLSPYSTSAGPCYFRYSISSRSGKVARQYMFPQCLSRLHRWGLILMLQYLAETTHVLLTNLHRYMLLSMLSCFVMTDWKPNYAQIILPLGRIHRLTEVSQSMKMEISLVSCNPNCLPCIRVCCYWYPATPS